MRNGSGKILEIVLAIAVAGCGPSQEPTAAGGGGEAEARMGAAARRPEVPRLDWAPCGGDMEGLECATALVPLEQRPV